MAGSGLGRQQFRIARDLDALGVVVIPLHHPGLPLPERLPEAAIGKSPLIRWQEFQQRRPTTVELVRWFDVETLRNFGVLTGPISGILAIDCGDVAASALADAILPATPIRTITATGEQRLFRYPIDTAPGEVFGNRTGLTWGGVRYRLDMWGAAGYIVVPPSMHASGVEYSAPTPWAEVWSQMPRVTAADVRALCKASARVPSTAPAWTDPAG